MITKLRLTRTVGRIAFCAAALIVCAMSVQQPRAIASDDSSKLKKDYALIVGTVWSADNRPVYGVRILVHRADAKNPKKGVYERVSDHNGEFAVRVPPDAADYVVRADVKTPKGEPQPEAKIHVDGQQRVEVGLHLK